MCTSSLLGTISRDYTKLAEPMSTIKGSLVSLILAVAHIISNRNLTICQCIISVCESLGSLRHPYFVGSTLASDSEGTGFEFPGNQLRGMEMNTILHDLGNHSTKLQLVSRGCCPLRVVPWLNNLKPAIVGRHKMKHQWYLGYYLVQK